MTIPSVALLIISDKLTDRAEPSVKDLYSVSIFVLFRDTGDAQRHFMMSP